jgi:hypothetical protein
MIDARVVDLYAFNLHSISSVNRDPFQDRAYVVIILVVFLEHMVGDVRNVLARVRLSSEIHISPSQIERLHKVLPKAHEVSRDVLFIVDLLPRALGTRTEASSDGLINPNHVCQIDP